MPQPIKTEKNIEEFINDLKGGVGIVRIAEIINKFAPTPDDRMAIFDYFYKVLDKEITVKEFAQNLLQKLSIKQEDRKRLIIEINQKIFRFLEDCLKKEPAPFAPQKEFQIASPKIEQTPAQIPRQEAPKPELPKLVAPSRPAFRPQISRPFASPRTTEQGSVSREQIAAIAKPEADSRRQAADSRDSDRYRETVPEEPGKPELKADSRQQTAAIAKPEPKIQGNIVDLRNNF